MCYHFATLRLFRPFLGVQLSGSTISSADTSHQAADAIQSLLRSYSQLYTLLKTPSLVPYLTLGSAISHLDVRITRVQAKVTTMGAATSHHNLEAVDQDVADLRQMMFCHVSAEQALNVLGHHSTKQSMRIGITGDEALADEYERLIRPYLRPLWAPGRRSRRVHFLPPP